MDFENFRSNSSAKNALSSHQNEESINGLAVENFSSISDDGFGQDKLNLSIDSISQFQTRQAHYNNLEESISIVERSAKKLLPIYKELFKRLVQVRKQTKKEEIELEDTNSELDKNLSDDQTD